MQMDPLSFLIGVGTILATLAPVWYGASAASKKRDLILQKAVLGIEEARKEVAQLREQNHEEHKQFLERFQGNYNRLGSLEQKMSALEVMVGNLLPK